jgi:hypothetical protein
MKRGSKLRMPSGATLPAPLAARSGTTSSRALHALPGEQAVGRMSGPRLKPGLFSCSTARLKARPDTNQEFFRKL